MYRKSEGRCTVWELGGSRCVQNTHTGSRNHFHTRQIKFHIQKSSSQILNPTSIPQLNIPNPRFPKQFSNCRGSDGPVKDPVVLDGIRPLECRSTFVRRRGKR